MNNTKPATLHTARKGEQRLRRLVHMKKTADVLLNPIVIYTAVTAMIAPTFLDLQVILLGLVFPAVTGMIMQRTKKIQTYWDATTARDRSIIIFINLVFYITLMTIFIATRVAGVIRVLVLVANIIMFLSLVLVYIPRWSISGHFASLAAVITYICIQGNALNLDLTSVAIIFILLFGIKSYLWLETKQSSGREIASSALLGHVVSMLCFYLTV